MCSWRGAAEPHIIGDDTSSNETPINGLAPERVRQQVNGDAKMAHGFMKLAAALKCA